MPIDVMLPDDLETAEFARFGILGANGSGKSTVAASAARARRNVIVASVGVENTKPYRGYNGRIRVSKLNTWDDLFPFMKMVLSLLKLRGKKDVWVPNVLVFDTWTRMQGSAAKKISGWNPPTPPPPGSSPAAEKEYLAALQSALKTAPKTPNGWAAWQQIGELSNQWIGYFMDLPIHILWLFQEEVRTPTSGTGEKVIQTGPTKIGPMLTPAAIGGVRDNLELLGRLYDPYTEPEDDPLNESPFGKINRQIDPDRKETRRLLIGPHPLYLTKGPTHALGYAPLNPTWRMLEKSLSASPFRVGDEPATPETPATAKEEN